MFLSFNSMLWLSDSYNDITPPTLAFSIFKGFCLNVSFFAPYTEFCSQLVKVKHSPLYHILALDLSELFELIA